MSKKEDSIKHEAALDRIRKALDKKLTNKQIKEIIKILEEGGVG